MKQKKENCKTCNKGISNNQKFMIGVSVFILMTSIYGTIEIVKKVVGLF